MTSMGMWMRISLVVLSVFMMMGSAQGDDGEDSNNEEAYNPFLYKDSSFVREYLANKASSSHGNPPFMTTSNPTVVEFYSPTCPACVEFRPEYEALAQGNYPSNLKLEFHSVSCDVYVELCQSMNIQDFPSMILFTSTHGSRRNQRHLPVPDGQGGVVTPVWLLQQLTADSNVVLAGQSTKMQRRMDDSPNFVNDSPDDEEEDQDEDKDDDDKNETDADEDEDENEPDADEDEDEDKDSDNENKDDDEGPEESKEDSDDGPAAMDAAMRNRDINPFAAARAREDESGDVDEPSADKDNDEDESHDNVKSEDEEESPDNESPDRDGVLPPLPLPPQLEEEHAKYEQFRGEPIRPEAHSSNTNNSNRRHHRRPGAGAAMAREKTRDMDRFKQLMKERRKEIEKKHRGIRRVFNGDISRLAKDKHGKPIVKTNPESMTKAMKVNTPGTAEYEERRERLIKRIEKAQRHRRKHADKNGGNLMGTINYKEKGALKKETLPFVKEVRKPMIREKIPIVRRYFKMTSEEELILDTSLSLVTALETSIFSSDQPLNPVQQKTLHTFLDLLSISLPPEWGIHRLLDTLRGKFAYIVRSDKNLRQILHEHPLPRRSWSKSCVFGKESRVGFSCGFWKLLHVVTVGVAEHRGGQNLIDSGMVSPATHTFSPMEAADAIRDYIEHFFTCRACKTNFLKIYDDCDRNRRCDRLTEQEEEASTADWKELATWLWEFHNEVSVRIVHERAEKMNALTGHSSTHRAVAMSSRNGNVVKNEIAVVWPNIEICFLCFRDDGTWDEEEVFKFLERSYWPDSDLDPRADKLLKFEGESDSSGFILWLLVFFVVYVIYKVIGSSSASIHHNLYQAKIAVQTTTRQVVSGVGGGSKKSRDVKAN